jgi:hypothetical protein
VPAVLLFVPWRLLTQHDLPENLAIVPLAFGGFLFSCGTFLRVLSLAGAKPGPLVISASFLALGMCQLLPYLLGSVAVYEIAIAGGYFCVSAAMFFLARGLNSANASFWLAVSGLLFGMAVGSRPPQIFTGLVAAVGLAALAARSFVRWRGVVFFLAGLGVAGLGLALYNYARFGDPLEFGLRYLVVPLPGQNRLDHSVRNMLPGLYFLLLSPPQVTTSFPWVRMAVRAPFGASLPPGYVVERAVGALWMVPFLVAAPLIRSVRAAAANRAILWISVVSSLAIFSFLITTHLATQRYEVDFVPLTLFAAAVNLAIYVCHASGIRRAAWIGACLISIGYSAVANFSVAAQGPDGAVWKRQPGDYLRLARWFGPSRPVREALTATLAAHPSDFGSGQYTFHFSNANGNLGVENILINTTLDGHHACWLTYTRPTDMLYLMNDAGDALMPGKSMTSGGELSNRQCMVRWGDSAFAATRNDLTLTLEIDFRPGFGQKLVFYVAARDLSEKNGTGWQAFRGP